MSIVCGSTSHGSTPIQAAAGVPASGANLRGDPPAKASDSVTTTTTKGAEPRVVEIEFLSARPVPFRMELSPRPDSSEYIELTPAPDDAAFQQRIRQVVQSEFARYPEGTLDSLVDLIIIGGEVSHSGRPVDGAYLFNLVFIAIGEKDLGRATDQRVAITLHHEISSLFRDRYRRTFDEVRFRAALPLRFVYEDERPDVNGSAPARPWESVVPLVYLEAGFLKPRAMRNLEQDLSSYAEELFVRPARLLRMFAGDSLVARKARVVRDFYVAIDARFAAILDGEGSTLFLPPATSTVELETSTPASSELPAAR